MRDLRFVAEHRGGPLTHSQHKALMTWALLCVKHAMEHFAVDPVLNNAMELGQFWVDGQASVGDARDAALACHALARSIDNPAEQDLARACGHAVATAHMADHSLQAARYAVRAVQTQLGTGASELAWQVTQVSDEIRHLVQSTRPAV